MKTNRTPDTSGPLLPLAVLLPLLLALLGWSLVFPAQAGERRARLTIELEVEGASPARGGNDTASWRLSRRYRLVTYLRADGDPMNVNPKAPDYAQTMMARAGQGQARVVDAQAMNAKAAQMQQLQAACGADRACLMRALMPQLNAAQRTAAAAPRQADEGEEDAHFLLYSGVDRCDARFEVRADESSTGQYADVQGMVPWRETSTATGSLSADELRLLCLNFSLVLDTRTQAISTDAGFNLPEAHSLSTRTERGRTERSEGRLAGLPTVAQWLAERTRQAPRSGSASATLPRMTPGTQGRNPAEGTLQVKASWKFEDL